MSSFFISAAHKSSGKTILSIGICAALKNQHYCVQPFKKGPDYIDPLWLSLAAGQPCYNLDFYTMTHQEIRSRYAIHAQGKRVILVEGNKGLYDGLDLDGSNSNAALAKYLQLPVILVLDAQGMTRGVAPLILGYQAFDPDIKIAGVILNKLGGRRHEEKLRKVIEYYTAIKVVGAVYRDERLQIAERHLGLIPSNEALAAEAQIQRIAQAIAEQVDLSALLAMTDSPMVQEVMQEKSDPMIVSEFAHTVEPPAPVVIGIAQDAAFGFYYPDDLLALTQAGATLVKINTLQDQQLPPDLDGLLIGGGFPEVHMDALEANQSLRQAIQAFVEQGYPVYAECGGLMYLAQNITWKNQTCAMVGALPVAVEMMDKPQGRGYVQLQETGQGLWPVLPGYLPQAVFPAHEFHYSRLQTDDHLAPLTFAYRVLRGTGINGEFDGIVYKNTLACYTHLRDGQNHHWAWRFVAFVRQCQQQRHHTKPQEQ